MSDPVYDEPTEVATVDGKVTLDGPDGVDVTMTPRAARETALRLAIEAGRASEQARAKSQPASSSPPETAPSH